MRQLRAVWKRLQNQLAARGLDRDFGDELDTLFAMHLEENRRAGDHDTFSYWKAV